MERSSIPSRSLSETAEVAEKNRERDAAARAAVDVGMIFIEFNNDMCAAAVQPAVAAKRR